MQVLVELIYRVLDQTTAFLWTGKRHEEVNIQVIILENDNNVIYEKMIRTAMN